MSKKQRDMFLSFIKWVSVKYVELDKQALPYRHKLLGYRYDSENLICIARIQSCGQAAWFERPNKILIDSNEFQYFSPEDIKVIFLPNIVQKNLFFAIISNVKIHRKTSLY